MLEQMRQAAQSWVAKLLFGILVVSFGFWGVADVFRGWGRGSVATVGSTAISDSDFQRAYQKELDRLSRSANKRITAEQGRALGLDRRVLSQLIGGSAIETHAADLGLALSDKTLLDGLANDPDFRGADGKFSREGFMNLLRQAGLSERGFLHLRRQDELRMQLLGAMVRSQVVPQPLFDALHAYNGEKRVLEWIRIDPDAVSVADPDEAKIKELYEAGKSRYMTPEYRKFQALLLTVDDLKKQVAVTDEDIAKTYEATKDSYDTPEQRRVQQISFKDRAAAEAALAALKGGKSFGDVAKDAGAKDTDVDLGLITRKQLIDPKIADAAFKLAKDAVSDVVEGRFTTAIVRVTQIEPGITRTLADVKDQVRDKIAAEKAQAELQHIHDEVDDLRLAGKTLADIAAAKKLTFADVAAADAKGLGVDGKPAMAVEDASKIVAHVFAPDRGSDDQSIELTGGYAWVNVLSTEPPKQKPLEEVKADVKTAFVTSERQRLLNELAKSLADRVNNGEPMSALEAAAKTKPDKTEPITRKTLPQGLSDAAVAQAFALAKGRAGHAISSDKTTQVVFKVEDIIAAPAATLTETEELKRGLEADLVNQTLTEYTEAIKARYGVSVNEAEFRRLTGQTDQ